jgi:hypothetical protein
LNVPIIVSPPEIHTPIFLPNTKNHKCFYRNLERDNSILLLHSRSVNKDPLEEISMAASLCQSVLDALTDVEMPKRHPSPAAPAAQGSIDADGIRLPIYRCDARVLGSGAARRGRVESGTKSMSSWPRKISMAAHRHARDRTSRPCIRLRPAGMAMISSHLPRPLLPAARWTKTPPTWKRWDRCARCRHCNIWDCRSRSIGWVVAAYGSCLRGGVDRPRRLSVARWGQPRRTRDLRSQWIGVPITRNGPLEAFRFRTERKQDRAEKIAIRFENGAFTCSFQQIRRHDHAQAAYFERDWAEFLSGAIY